MTNTLDLRQRLRSGHVKRWHIVRVGRDQTIAEHMYRVWLIVCRVVEDSDFGVNDVVRSRLAKEWALVHDLPEVVTGDLPSPSKTVGNVAKEIEQFEARIDTCYGEFHEYLKTDHPYVLIIVKLAELIEMIDFLQIEAIGDHAHEVLAGIERQFRRDLSTAVEEWPNLSWSVFTKIRNSEL